MVVRIVPNSWAATTTYAQGAAVQHNGVKFTAAAAITGRSTNVNPVEEIANKTPDGITRSVFSVSRASNAVVTFTQGIPFQLQAGDRIVVTGVSGTSSNAGLFNRTYVVSSHTAGSSSVTTTTPTSDFPSSGVDFTTSSANIPSNWDFAGVLDIVDYYSLQYAIQEILNVDDEQINNSIPAFVQQAEALIGKTLRSPAQLERRIFMVDSESRFAIPGDLLEVSHMRRNTDDASYDLRSRGSISIVRAADRESWERLNQYYANTGPWFENSANYTFPYWITDNTHFFIAPSYDVGTEIELEYYQTVPQLGSVVNRVNDNYEAVNSAGQTLAQWIAAGGSNNAGNFVQEMITVTTNLWTATQPNLLKSAACVEAYRYLNNVEQTQVWEQQFAIQLAAAETEFSRFEASGPAGLQQESAYC